MRKLYNTPPTFAVDRKPTYSPPRGRQSNVKVGKPEFKPTEVVNTIYDDPEMQERERLAQEEIERKKLCTAPAYNKGAYQYIASEEQAKDIGR